MLRHTCDVTFSNEGMTPGHCKPILAAATSGGEAYMKLESALPAGPETTCNTITL